MQARKIRQRDGVKTKEDKPVQEREILLPERAPKIY